MGTHPIFESDFDCLTEKNSEMGSYLQKPVVEKSTEEGTGQGFQWASTGMQGWRTSMEDSHIHLGHLSDQLKSFGLFVVFDGHSGAQYANKVAKDFPPFLLAREPFASMEDGAKYDCDAIKIAIHQAFLDFDAKCVKSTISPPRDARQL